MKNRLLVLGIMVGCLFSACGGSNEPLVETDDDFIPGGSKADEAGFEYGFYSGESSFEYEDGNAIFIAFHNVQTGLPEHFAGHFDYAVFNEKTETTDYINGVFKLYRFDGRQRIRLDSYEGKTIGRFDWTLEDRTLTLGDYEFDLRNYSKDEKTIVECEAFQVVEYEFEESFTPWEYPSVYVELDDDGNLYEVQFGMSSYTADEANLDMGTNEAGDFEAIVKVDAEDYEGNTLEDQFIYVLRIPNANPTRGDVLFGEKGEELKLMARVVCYNNPAGSVSKD